MKGDDKLIAELNERIFELEITRYVLVGICIISVMFSAIIFSKNKEYEHDIIMAVSDVANRQRQLDKWEDFNKSYIPETDLPRLRDVKAIYNEEIK